MAEGAVFLWILQVATEFQHVVWIHGCAGEPLAMRSPKMAAAILF